MEYVQKQLLKLHDPFGKRKELVSKTGLRAGDIIKVTYTDRTDVTGKVIGIKRGHNNLGTNILIRTKLQSIGSELRIPLYNPKIRNIERVWKPEEYRPRNQQYYIRGARFDVDDVEEFVKREISRPARMAIKMAKREAEQKAEAVKAAKREAKRLKREKSALEHALSAAKEKEQKSKK